MALFGRKKNEDSEFDTEGGYSDEEALIEEEEKEDKKLTKKLRELFHQELSKKALVPEEKAPKPYSRQKSKFL